MQHNICISTTQFFTPNRFYFSVAKFQFYHCFQKTYFLLIVFLRMTIRTISWKKAKRWHENYSITYGPRGQPKFILKMHCSYFLSIKGFVLCEVVLVVRACLLQMQCIFSPGTKNTSMLIVLLEIWALVIYATMFTFLKYVLFSGALLSH